MVGSVVLSLLLFLQIALAGYTEHLTLRPLPRNTLLTSFEFESTTDALPEDQFFSNDTLNYQQYTTFPRTLGQLLGQSNTKELHLRFSQGWWDAESWGAQPDNGIHSGGIGVELWAWVEASSLLEAEARWNKLVNTLSGFFCASLNFIDSSHTTFPAKSFYPDGNHGNVQLYLLRGALPREPVCTENLTPFIKLLPCKGKAGISSLLDGHKIFDSQWQGMSVDVVPRCEDGQCKLVMTQIIDAVVDVPRQIARGDRPVPKPVDREHLRCDTSKPYSDEWKCFPLNEETEVNWKLSEIFGREISGRCPLAENFYHISVKAPEPVWSTQMHTKDELDQLNIQMSSQLTLEKAQNYDVFLSSTNTREIEPITIPPVYVERSFTGYGQDRGGMRSVFTNPSDSEQRFVYFETFPWYMRLYLHTLKVEIRDSVSTATELVKDLRYRPAVDRKQPSEVEIEIVLPAHTTATLSYDFEKQLLFLEEYPPDANRGFDIAPGVLTAIGGRFTIRTTSLLLSLPTPDFSMPYNVIILTCTVMALTFGTVFNLLIKRTVTEEEAEYVSSQSRISQLIARIKQKLEGPKRGPYPYENTDKRIPSSSN